MISYFWMGKISGWERILFLTWEFSIDLSMKAYKIESREKANGEKSGTWRAVLALFCSLHEALVTFPSHLGARFQNNRNRTEGQDKQTLRGTPPGGFLGHEQQDKPVKTAKKLPIKDMSISAVENITIPNGENKTKVASCPFGPGSVSPLTRPDPPRKSRAPPSSGSRVVSLAFLLVQHVPPAVPNDLCVLPTL